MVNEAYPYAFRGDGLTQHGHGISQRRSERTEPFSGHGDPAGFSFADIGLGHRDAEIQREDRDQDRGEAVDGAQRLHSAVRRTRLRWARAAHR